jgi:hypothetical protein
MGEGGRGLMDIADRMEIEDKLLKYLYKSCPKQNKGYRAGKKSGSFSLGTKDMPLKINKKNVLDIVFCDLAAAYKESLTDNIFSDFSVILHPAVMCLIRKCDIVSYPVVRNNLIGHVPWDGSKIYIFCSPMVPVEMSGGGDKVFSVIFTGGFPSPFDVLSKPSIAMVKI